MNKQDKIIKSDDKDSILAILKQPTVKIAEALTGILSAEKNEWKLSAGKLVQATIKGKLLTQLGRELEYYRKKGEIKEDYFSTTKNQASLSELLKFIDEEVPDEERFQAMKSIFLSSIVKDAKEQEEELAYEMMQICKKLSSGEILILKAAFNIANDFNKDKSKIDKANSKASDWFNAIASQIGHSVPELIQRHEKNLVNLQLISPRNQPKNFNIAESAFVPTQYFRLTKAGYKLCELIAQYQDDKTK